MQQANVFSIHIAPEAGAPVVSVEAAHAMPGRGLDGDRYCSGIGTYSFPIRLPLQELTLIEIEQIEAVQREYGIALAAGDARRNVVTRGVSLNDLVGREFRIGEVLLRGQRLCDPCSHLAKLTDPAVLYGLVNRGGLRAQILTEGTIRIGDKIAIVWLLKG